MMKKIGLVTVLFNSNEVLPDFFKSLSIQTFKNFVLILIDNTPSELSEGIVTELAEKYKIEFEYRQMSSNIGIAAGNNEGIKLAKTVGCGDIIILNNDICFDSPSFFESLINLSLESEKVIIAPKIYFYNSNILWYAGGTVINWKGTAYHFGHTKDTPQLNISTFTNYAPTCFLYVKEEVFEKVGLMDEKYFVYVDDVDFIFRAKYYGFKVWYAADLSLFHKVSSSTGGTESEFGLRFNTRNKIYFIRKFLSFPYNITAPIFTIVAALYFGNKAGRKSIFSIVFKAMFEGYRMQIDNRMQIKM